MQTACAAPAARRRQTGRKALKFETKAGALERRAKDTTTPPWTGCARVRLEGYSAREAFHDIRR